MEAKVIVITVVLNESDVDVQHVAESIVNNMKYCDSFDRDGILYEEGPNIKEVTWKLSLGSA